MSEGNNKIKLSALLMATLISANFVCYGEAYKNNVVDVRVNKEAGNAVKVTIYTDRPYTEPVVVNKKANNKYVILMPETKSSLKASPTVTNGSGTISNVSVNTQEVSGGKGYTKIIITSEKAINVVPRTQQMKGVKPANLNTTTTTKLSTTAPVKPNVTKSQSANDKKLAEQKAKQQAEAKAKQQADAKAKQQAEAKAKRQALAKQKQEQAKKLAEQRAKQQAQAQKLAQQKVSKPAVAVPPPPKKEPIQVLEQEVKTGQNSSLNSDSGDALLNKEINDNIKAELDKNQNLNNQPVEDVNTGNKPIIENIKSVLKEYRCLSLWKLLLLAGAITFPIIVIMVILTLDKNINKKIDKSFRKEDEQAPDYAPTVENSPQPGPEPSNQPVYSSFDEMLNKVDEPLPTYHEEQLHQAEYEKFTQSVNQPIEIDTPIIPVSEQPQQQVASEFNNDYSDSDFEHDFSQETPTVEPVDEPVIEPVVEPVIEPEITNEIPEPVIKEELKQEDTVRPSEPPVTPPAIVNDEPYNPDGSLADFSGVNDKDFFDELTMQTMARNNADGLPEELPADQIFDFMTDDEAQTDNIAYNQAVDDITESVAEIQNLQENTSVIGFDDEPVQEPQQQEDELTMLTEAKLDDNKGMYLVNYDNFSSLVGHIGDDYFVIKKFDELVNSRIILKETEKLKDSTRYLVRVGKNKMVVEITDTSMNRLLDL